MKKPAIKHWKEDDRPREKLLSKGVSVLSDSELIAILLGSGNREESAVDLAKRILSSVDNKLSSLTTLDIIDYMKFKGVGKAKASTLLSAVALVKRASLENATRKPKIQDSKSAFNFIHPLIGHLHHEEFWVMFLNNSNHIISTMQLSKGGVTGTLVDMRILFKRAIEVLSVGFILFHNHPSQKAEPSTEDMELTEQIKEGGEILDISLLDHIIITQNSYYSFADQQLL